MTRVLVVYHDVDVADIEVDELRRAGYEVDQCAGPIGGDPCPVASGQPCWQVEQAPPITGAAPRVVFGRLAILNHVRGSYSGRWRESTAGQRVC